MSDVVKVEDVVTILRTVQAVVDSDFYCKPIEKITNEDLVEHTAVSKVISDIYRGLVRI